MFLNARLLVYLGPNVAGRGNLLGLSGKVFWFMLHCHLQVWYLITMFKTPGKSSVIVLKWEPLKKKPGSLLVLALFSSLQNYSADWNGKNCESKCGVRLLLSSPLSILLCVCFSPIEYYLYFAGRMLAADQLEKRSTKTVFIRKEENFLHMPLL